MNISAADQARDRNIRDPQAIDAADLQSVVYDRHVVPSHAKFRLDLRSSPLFLQVSVDYDTGAHRRPRREFLAAIGIERTLPEQLAPDAQAVAQQQPSFSAVAEFGWMDSSANGTALGQ